MVQPEQVSEVTNIADLYDGLDSLWVQYLDLLETYTAAQEAIKAQLSAGFLSLAKANFHSSGRRYGQDSYDQRANASTRVRIETEDEILKVEVIKFDPSHESESKDDSASSKETSETQEDLQATAEIGDLLKEPLSAHLPTPASTPEPEIKADLTQEQPDTKEHSNDEESPKPKVDRRDPIRQFGILIPPALRSAQKSFSTAVLDPQALSRAVTAARAMREVELEIRRARKAAKKAEKLAAENV